MRLGNHQSMRDFGKNMGSDDSVRFTLDAAAYQVFASKSTMSLGGI